MPPSLCTGFSHFDGRFLYSPKDCRVCLSIVSTFGSRGKQFSFYWCERANKMFVMIAVLDQLVLRGCQLHTFIIIYALIVGTLVVVGIIGNSLAFAVFWKGNFKSSTSFLFMCLALTDSAVLITAFLVFSSSLWFPTWIHGAFLGFIFRYIPIRCLIQMQLQSLGIVYDSTLAWKTK